MGWHFHPANWGNGYATEAAQTVLTTHLNVACPG
ncbi:hypothetical protein [Pseudarthrobacter phenanthrenivorans]|nr:hypothetical protein [Pseudarthrobacter phenanthrenivorans]